MSAASKKKIKRRWGAPWTLAELKLLGKKTDSVLARRTGRTIKEVVAERERRRINLETEPRRWTAREIKLLGRLEIKSPVSIRPFTPAEDKSLGTAIDRVIGRRLGRYPATVAQRRRGLGVPAWGAHK